MTINGKQQQKLFLSEEARSVLAETAKLTDKSRSVVVEELIDQVLEPELAELRKNGG